jgi:tellurite resistance protein/uncharacterized protein (DUF697 family)
MERESVASICLMAAFVDGVQNDAERDKLRGVLTQIGMVDDSVFQRAVMRRTSVEEEAAKIADPDTRRLAYDLAVGVCAADGTTSQSEREFLHKLAALMNVPQQDAKAAVTQGDELADIKLEDVVGTGAAGAGTAGAAAAAGTNSGTQPEGVKTLGDEIDDTILKYSALNAGLELLPQSIATVAIIPLQTKMVYSIGARHGYKLDTGHIKEFIATVGLGMTSQVVESYARRFLSRIAGKFMGKTVGKIAEKATGPAMTFASTYALGHAAKAYYSGGRTLSMGDLRALFSRKLDEAKGVYEKHEGSIAESAKKLDPRKLVSLVRGA